MILYLVAVNEHTLLEHTIFSSALVLLQLTTHKEIGSDQIHEAADNWSTVSNKFF